MSKKIIVTLYFIFAALFFSIPLFSQETSMGADALCQEGIQYYEQGLSRLAAEYFRRCLQQDPANQQAKKYLDIIGQAYIAAVSENARQQYETALDVAETRSGSRYQTSYDTIDTMTQSASRNLDYRTAESSPFIARQAQPAQQITQQTVQEAKEDFVSQYNISEEAITQARQDYTREQKRLAREKNRKMPRERSEKVNKALEDAWLKMNFEYMFVWDGEQSFRIVTDTDDRLSKLTYPLRGGMGIATAEAKLLPRVFIGGRYGTSNFSNETSKDEDWNIWSGWIDDWCNYQITKQDTKNRAQLWDANLYFRLYDEKGEKLDSYLSEMFMIDRLYFDVFGGYQYYHARHTMLDPVKDVLVEDNLGVWWTVDPLPLSMGLNSAWEVTYKGPRLGCRLGGSFTEKLSSSVSLSYAWLDTKAFGNWNLRNFNFWQEGSGNGKAYNVDVEVLYHITPNWFASLGFHYMNFHQASAIESGNEAGIVFSGYDIVRDIDLSLYGPSLGLGCRF